MLIFQWVLWTLVVSFNGASLISATVCRTWWSLRSWLQIFQIHIQFCICGRHWEVCLSSQHAEAEETSAHILIPQEHHRNPSSVLQRERQSCFTGWWGDTWYWACGVKVVADQCSLRIIILYNFSCSWPKFTPALIISVKSGVVLCRNHKSAEKYADRRSTIWN